MFRVFIEGSELKAMLDKVQCGMAKKASIATLNNIVLSTQNGFQMTACNLTDGLENLTVQAGYTNFAESDEDVYLDKEDFKVLSKMNGIVEIEKQMDGTIHIRNGKKTIKLPASSLEPKDFDGILVKDFKEDFVLVMPETELLEILTKLSVFTEPDGNNKMFQCINFNLTGSQDYEEGRAEALEGHRIGIRRLTNTIVDGEAEDFMINIRALTALKKCLNKKSEEKVMIAVNKDRIMISGNGLNRNGFFRYSQKRTEGKYFNVNKMLEADNRTAFKVETEEAKEKVKYYVDNVVEKDNSRPLILTVQGDRLETKMRNSRMEVVDEIEIINHKEGNDIKIGVNPKYLMDCIDVADSVWENTLYVQMGGMTSPIYINAGELYKFMILPVNINAAA